MMDQPVGYSAPPNLRLLFGALLLLCWGGHAAAQLPGEVSQARDHSLMARFSGATIVEYAEESDVNYRLVLGNMRRIAGRVVPEQADRLRGDLTRLTYEIPDGYNGADVIAFFRAQAERNGYVTLYSCEGRGCGNSNYWANEVFDNRSLYGPERNQYYMALRADGDQGAAAYLAVYVTTRTNQRLLAHLEILESGLDGGAADNVAPEGEGALGTLLESRSLRLYGLVFDAEDRLTEASGIDAVVRLLEQNRNLAVYVVAHLGGSGGLASLLQRSQRRAEQVREQLLLEGISGDRVLARGIGPLAPGCSEGDCDERVELVLQ
ncbi:MAG: DUF4892 domain-containing protein [Gammaproteobacteria bacterium]|jgi:hypothetical protein